MRGILGLLALLGGVVGPAAAREADPEPPKPRRALNRAFKGRVVSLRKRTVTLVYDFEDPAQLEDFQEARPPNLLDASRNQARVEGGRLVLEGSSCLRHRMESARNVHATFKVRFAEKRNVGAVVTEPVLSDFYLVYNLFDDRFNRNGCMHIGACGLHEDEGAEDLSTGLVNFRDVFSRDIRGLVAVDQDVEVEVGKEGWKEFFRVGDVKGRGSSKGKTREMPALVFGFFVHGCRARFDDLTLVCELSDEYLELEGLEARLEPEPARPG